MSSIFANQAGFAKDYILVRFIKDNVGVWCVSLHDASADDSRPCFSCSYRKNKDHGGLCTYLERPLPRLADSNGLINTHFD